MKLRYGEVKKGKRRRMELTYNPGSGCVVCDLRGVVEVEPALFELVVRVDQPQVRNARWI